MTLLTYQKVI